MVKIFKEKPGITIGGLSTGGLAAIAWFMLQIWPLDMNTRLIRLEAAMELQRLGTQGLAEIVQDQERPPAPTVDFPESVEATIWDDYGSGGAYKPTMKVPANAAVLTKQEAVEVLLDGQKYEEELEKMIKQQEK